jgi:hypothetical protein
MAARRRSFLLPIGRETRDFDALRGGESTELGLGFGGRGWQPRQASRRTGERERKRRDSERRRAAACLWARRLAA